MKEKLSQIDINCKNKNIIELYKGINKFKEGYQARVSMIKNENNEFFALSHSSINRSKDFQSERAQRK